MKNDLFGTLGDILNPSSVSDKIPTSKGMMGIPEILDTLNYSSYCAQRDAGSTHEQLVKYECWNHPEFKTQYDAAHKK